MSGTVKGTTTTTGTVTGVKGGSGTVAGTTQRKAG
jgi:hypothetical protein